MGCHGVLVTGGVLHTPCLLDFAFLVPVAGVGYAMVARFSADATALRTLQASLAAQVEERSSQLGKASVRNAHRPRFLGRSIWLRAPPGRRIVGSVPAPGHGRFGRYVEYYGLVKSAVEAGDAELLHRIEVVSERLEGDDRKVSSLAIHDVALHLPMRSELHFAGVVEQDWDADNGYFGQLLESLRAKAAAKR